MDQPYGDLDFAFCVTMDEVLAKAEENLWKARHANNDREMVLYIKMAILCIRTASHMLRDRSETQEKEEL